MKLVSFGPPGEETPGVLAGDHVIDLLSVDASLPRTMREILAGDYLHRVEAAASGAPVDARRPRLSVRLGPPVTDPTKIICLGMNYRDHAAEQHKLPPEFPMLFSKGPNVLCGDGDAVPYPRGVEQLDFEAEMAFVIGRKCKHVPLEDARECVAGYTVFMDLSARDLQYREKQWFRGKSFDGAGPMGPCLVTRDEIPEPHTLRIALQVNGETMQDSDTGQMTFTVDYLVHHISQTMTLEAGDIVATGTPPGVGVFRDPPRFLHKGDRIETTIESIGTLTCAIA